MTTYKDKLKYRLYIAIGYIFIGIILCAVKIIIKTDNNFIMPYAIALIVCGITRIVKYFKITKNEQSIYKQEIEETDERNLEIVNRARSITFSFYIMIAGTFVIVLQFLGRQIESKMIAYNICGIIVIYWLSYMFVKKKC